MDKLKSKHNMNTGITVLVALLISCSVSAQVVSLDSVLHAIDKKHPMLQMFDKKTAALEAYTEGAKSWMAPMVGVGPFFYPYPGQMLMDERDKGMVSIAIEQDIPNPAKLKAKQNYLASQASVQQKERAYQFNKLRDEAKQNYYQWLVLFQQTKVLSDNKRIMEMMMKLAQIRYPYNQSSLGSIYKAEARLHEIENMIEMNKAESEEKELLLKAMMQAPADSRLLLDTTLVIDYQTTSEDNQLAQRSDVQKINRSIEVMRQNQLLQQSQAKPDFRIRYEHMQPVGNMPVQFSLMAMVSIPIAPWSSRMYKSEIKGMGYEIESMEKEKESILLETSGMLEGMKAQLLRMKTQLYNYQQKIIPALKKNYETVMMAYEENRGQLPEVIDAWEALNMTQMEHLQKLSEYYLMIVKYEKEIEK